MSLPTFCDACKARVEWHVTVAGKNIPIDPDPHAEGRFYFGPGLRLASGAPGTRRRMYRCHWDTCSRGTEASKRGLKPERGECYRCGSPDHYANACPERTEP